MNNKISIKIYMTVLLFGVIGIKSSFADDGLKIFQEAFERNAGYGNYESMVTMTLQKNSEKTHTRKMTIINLEMKNDGYRTMIIFKSPPDVDGTKILTQTHLTHDDEQWIYLPAFHRVKQISSANKTSSFMGSEFTYEDINSLNIVIPKFSYRFIANDAVSGIPCFKIERKPKYDNSAYSREIVWIDTKDYAIQKVEYYDLTGDLYKTLTLTGYKKYLNKYFRASDMLMVNHKNNNATTLDWKDYDFTRGYSKQDLSVSALNR